MGRWAGAECTIAMKMSNQVDDTQSLSGSQVGRSKLSLPCQALVFKAIYWIGRVPCTRMSVCGVTLCPPTQLAMQAKGCISSSKVVASMLDFFCDENACFTKVSIYLYIGDGIRCPAGSQRAATSYS